uniref:MAX gene-associated protein n=1 Tax=Scatophagus argus TaxID=75038 RepID=UPI001ED7E8C4|nr:MAX gene-associated protein [Scatophagus argus]XP_046229085.1 MAX gene-associated protein [Scatophagus argus]
MPATDSELTSMEDSHALKDEEGSLTNVPSSVPPTTVPPSTLLVPATTKPNLTSETVIETKAVSVASNDCSLALSSPAEASPAKPAVTSPTNFDETTETSPATSHIASASDSLNCTGTPSPVLPATTFGNPDPETDFPAILTFKGVSVTLENNGVWKQFNSRGTEMILTKQGRRMFPYCRYRLAGLDPEKQYSLVLSVVPSDCYRYRWNVSKWEVAGLADQQTQGVIRAFSHHHSPCRGSEWMNGLVSFYKLKLTNNVRDQRGHIILHSMHRYIPRLHIIPVLDGKAVTPEKPIFMGTESIAFTFPQTEFMAVTTYQNFRITQLKINHNPFAKGFREDGNNSRLNRFVPLAPPVAKPDSQPSALEAAELSQTKEEVVDLNTKNDRVSPSLSNNQKTRLVLKPIMSTIASKDELYVPCIRGSHALGELVLVQKHPGVEPSLSVTRNTQQGFRAMPLAKSTVAASTVSTPGSSSGYRKKRRRINRRWANSRGREWKAATASPSVVHSPSLTVAMQPELDDVEGLLFVSFSSKEALEVHVRDKQTNNSSSAAPVSLTTPMRLKQTVGVIPETDEGKMARLETVLLQDLHVLKHRQVIHPVLQEVGMKLSSLDPTKSIDLQYLGVRLPLPPPNQPEQGNTTPAGDDGLPFISRTGKTSDMTKIKGWKNKFIKSKETPPSNFDGSQKNLSAFCSNMLDEYLESEAQYISERAAAFSTNPEASVAYRLPAKGSSYVKTLESVLKHRNTASKFPVGTNKPCPLSHKLPPNSAPTSSASPLASPSTSVQTGAQLPGTVITNAASGSSSIFHRLSAYLPGVSQKSVACFGQSHGVSHRTSGLTKFQLNLLNMETGALNEGLSRTQLTQDRLKVALSVILTKEMQASQILKGIQYPKNKPKGPECGQDFCRLGCLCSSLQQVNRGPLHCRRPECMIGCSCFKRKITKQLSVGESEQPIQPVYSVTSMAHLVQPRPGTHTNRLWNRNVNDVDPDPLFTPKSAPLHLVSMKAIKRSSVSRPPQLIREEDKDPVYKYLESMMTCARVREFNSKPPPEVSMEPKILDISAPNITEKAGKATADDLLKKYSRNLLTVKKTEKTSQGTTSNETDVRKQIEIQSACQWDKDCNKVVEALCQRMNQNRLSQRFYIGPYCIHPVAKISIRKPSGSLLTYRVRISKPSQTSDDEDEFDDGDEDWDMEAEEEGDHIEDPVMRVGVTPFLSGVLPVGKLRAKTKPVGFQAHGLIQVNGKSYNQARLLLGSMGSLHPANRLAAYVTGRLHMLADISHKTSQKSDPTSQINTPGALHIKAAGTVVPPIITARKTTELKTPTQPAVGLSQADTCRKGSIALPPVSQTSSNINPVHTLALGQRNSVNPFQSSTSSPVSLTVSPSLKTPSFLGQSGTYSFRICPPANQGTKDQNLPGVTLPGGFTLIQLPTHGAEGGAEQSESASSTNKADVDKAPPPPLSTFARSKNLLSSGSVGPVLSSSGLVCDEKMPSDGSGEAKIKQEASNLDITSEDLSSNSSDYYGEGDEDEEDVDIETVEEVRQGLMISKMKEALRKALKQSRGPSDNFEPAREVQGQMDNKHEESKANRRRKNHTVLERQRRSELRNLFDKLQTILQSDPKAPRLRLLSLALKEIQNLVETSRYLEEKKRRLIQMQSVYVKELSLLSGKSDKAIKHKLKQICDRQKLRENTQKWRPFFSSLLQSRAAYLQTNPQSKLLPSPLSQPDRFMTLFPASLHTTASQHNRDQRLLPNPHSMSVAVSSPAQVEVTAPSPQEQPGEPATPSQVTTSSSTCQPQVPSVTAILKVTTGQNGASPVTSAPHSSNPSVRLRQPLTYPLIRSKTGRIILPSSLKPTGQVYTVMVMNAKKKEEDGENNRQPPDMDSSKNRSNSLLKSDHSSESCHILDEEKTVKSVEEEKTSSKSSNSEPKRSDVKPPLAELALLNKSIFVPLVAVQAAENSQEGGAVAGLRKKLAIPPLRRGRGRPRKSAVIPVSENRKPTVVEHSSKSASESETSILDEESQNETMTLELAKDTSEMVSDDPVPVKRGRGRPPKKSMVGWMRSRPTMGAGSNLSKSDEDDPVGLLFKSPRTKSNSSPATTSLLGDRNASRPLTRGALGKDFPSAKKRSWKDIEKELEPELQSE